MDLTEEGKDDLGLQDDYLLVELLDYPEQVPGEHKGLVSTSIS